MAPLTCRSRRPRHILPPDTLVHACLIFIAILATGGSATATPPKSIEINKDAAARSLQQTIQTQLREGKTSEALTTAQAALQQFPDDAAVRSEFMQLHLAVARQMFSEEDYEIAETALKSVLSVSPQNAEALGLSRTLDTARRAVPERVKKARRWIRLEWFEPAFNTLRQAGALMPDNKDAWKRDFLRAAIGAGDDHYLCKNFRQAFYYYDAAIKLIEESHQKPPSNLLQCWVQSLVFSLEEEVRRRTFPSAYWRIVSDRVEKYAPRILDGKILQSMLRGLSFENLGAMEVAASEYAMVSGRSGPSSDEDSVANIRGIALRRLRAGYDVRLNDRRNGFWAKFSSGDWQTHRAERYVIYHRNKEVAQRVSEALDFQFDRIARKLGTTAEEITWAMPITLYLYANEEEFTRVSKQPASVRAISRIRHQGSNLLEQTIEAYQTDPLLLASTLPHELTHLIVAALTDYEEMNASLSEGLALNMEPLCRQAQFSRLFAKMDTPPTLDLLLRGVEVHPNSPDFYAASFRLVNILRKQTEVNALLTATGGRLTSEALSQTAGFENPAALEAAYRGDINMVQSRVGDTR